MKAVISVIMLIVLMLGIAPVGAQDVDIGLDGVLSAWVQPARFGIAYDVEVVQPEAVLAVAGEAILAGELDVKAVVLFGGDTGVLTTVIRARASDVTAYAAGEIDSESLLDRLTITDV